MRMFFMQRDLQVVDVEAFYCSAASNVEFDANA